MRPDDKSPKLSQRKVAMPWHSDGSLSDEEARPISVRKAGFRGLVGDSGTEEIARDHWKEHNGFDEEGWEHVRPEPTRAEQRGFEMHGEYPDSYHERHDRAYQNHMDEKWSEEVPDHIDDHLGHFVLEHGNRKDWEKGGGHIQNVDLRNGVWATQSHVSQHHIERYLKAPNDRAWYLQRGGDDDGYLGNRHPMFVTHEGRLHAIDGHHRVASALQRGETHVQGWHFDLDKHPINYESDIHKHPDGTREWAPTDRKCPDCKYLHGDSEEHGQEIEHAR